MDKTMIEKLNKSKLPIITIDKNLEEKYYFQKNQNLQIEFLQRQNYL